MVAYAKPPDSSIKIYYLPFGIQTYAPVTENNIEAQAFVSVALKHDWISGEISSCISRRDAISMDKNRVRLKIIIKGDAYLFDGDGNGVMNKKVGVRLDVAKISPILSPEKVVIPLGPPKIE